MKNKTYCGVGINDSDTLVEVKKIVNGKKKLIWRCPFYQAWRNMITRCYTKKRTSRNETYTKCYVCNEWLVFSVFKRWMVTQDWKNKQLDKDLIIEGNNVYSPNTCAFISKELNMFLTTRSKSRGTLPLGVSLHKQRGKFRAQCSNQITGKNEFLGLFSCEIDAHNAWKKRKLDIAKILSSEIKDDRIKGALLSRYTTD